MGTVRHLLLAAAVAVGLSRGSVAARVEPGHAANITVYHVNPKFLGPKPVNMDIGDLGGVHFTNLSYLDGLFEHHILELAGQLGVGLQINFGRHFSIHTDVRFLSVYKNLGTSTEVRSDCIKSSAGGTGYCNGLANMDPDDQFNIGVQFQAGVTYYF